MIVKEEKMRKIDNYILDLLRADEHRWLTSILGYGDIELEPFAYIGSRRNVDLLVTILNYPNGKQKVAIEVENDREFDVDAIVQKIKKDYTYPTIVIIPKENKKDAWLFQTNLVKVWFWDLRFNWECRHCKKVFTTTSSRQPDECALCSKSGKFANTDVASSDKPFLEADNNPYQTFREIQARLHKGFFS